MKPFTFALMLLLQRVDEATRLERLKARPDRSLLAELRGKRRALGTRLRRSLMVPRAAES
jgi:hypothetical protein